VNKLAATPAAQSGSLAVPEAPKQEGAQTVSIAELRRRWGFPTPREGFK
jgi:hypothetical protein